MISLDYHVFVKMPFLRVAEILSGTSGVSRSEAMLLAIMAVAYLDSHGPGGVGADVVEFACGWTTPGRSGQLASALVASGICSYAGDDLHVVDWEFWRQGLSADYGPKWKAARAEALTRDGEKCVRCGSTCGVDVHHRVPLRKFGRDFARANALTNLETLCEVCHPAADAAFRSSED